MEPVAYQRLFSPLINVVHKLSGKCGRLYVKKAELIVL
jgi:hypothetical protein